VVPWHSSRSASQAWRATNANRLDRDLTWELPFTEGELLAAIRQVMSDAEAQEVMAQMRAPLPTAYPRNASGYHLTEGMLDLLAAVSEDMAMRVQRYRDEQANALQRSKQFRDEWRRKHGREPPDSPGSQ